MKEQPARDLTTGAVIRILEATGLEITDDIRENAERLFLEKGPPEKGLLLKFHILSDAFVADANPTQTKKDIERALRACDTLYNIFTRKEMDKNRASELVYIYTQARNKFGMDYVPGCDELSTQIKHLEFVLREALRINEPRIGKQPARTTDSELDWLVSRLSAMFKEIFGRTPAIDSRPGKDRSRNSPFLRFALQSMSEIADLGYDIKKKSLTFEAIRKRLKRIKASS